MVQEIDLIEKSKGGDTAAFSTLIGRYEDKIFSLARHVCAGMPSEAEDVYQETFVTAFKKIRGFRKQSNLGTWLYRIASNLCWLRFRKKKREPFVALLDMPQVHEEEPPRQFRDWSPTPEEVAHKKELRGAVDKALGALPVEYRLVLTLRDIEDLSNEETAKILGLSVAAVKSRLHRGRMLLRDRFEDIFGDGEKP